MSLSWSDLFVIWGRENCMFSPEGILTFLSSYSREIEVPKSLCSFLRAIKKAYRSAMVFRGSPSAVYMVLNSASGVASSSWARSSSF